MSGYDKKACQHMIKRCAESVDDAREEISKHFSSMDFDNAKIHTEFEEIVQELKRKCGQIESLLDSCHFQ